MGNGGEAEPVPNTALPSPEWFCLKTVEGKRTGMAATALHDRGEEDWILQYIPWACPLLNHLCDDQMWPEGTTLQKKLEGHCCQPMQRIRAYGKREFRTVRQLLTIDGGQSH